MTNAIYQNGNETISCEVIEYKNTFVIMLPPSLTEAPPEGGIKFQIEVENET